MKYKGTQKTDDTDDQQTESMLQFYLDMLTIQSFNAFAIVVYAKEYVDPEEFRVKAKPYFKDIRNLLDAQFNDDDEVLGVLPIFEKRLYTKFVFVSYLAPYSSTLISVAWQQNG